MPHTNEAELSISDYLGVLRRRWRLCFVVVGTVLLIGVAIAQRRAPIYESTGVLLAEEPEVPDFVVRSTVPNYPEERVRIITQRVLTTPNLERIIEQNGLYPDLVGSPGAAIREFRSHLELSAEDPEILESIMGTRQADAALAFSLTFGDTSAVVARDVTNDLVALYLEENQLARRRQAEETARFLNREAERLEGELADREGRLAEFKQRNSGSLPEAADLNAQLLDRAERDLDGVEREIRTLRERRELYARELAQLSPHLPVVNQAGETVLGPEDRLQLLQREYARLSAIYSQDHPDVARVRRELEALQGATGLEGSSREALQTEIAMQREALDAARERYSEDHPDVQRLERRVASLQQSIDRLPATAPPVVDSGPDNPAYIQRQVQLDATESELAAAVERRDELRARVAGLEQNLSASPEVEREYSELQRGYQQLEAQYNDVQSKLREAETALNLEAESKGERFTVLDAPGIAQSPAQPNRMAVLLLSVVLAFAMGAGAVAVAEQADGSVRSVRDVTRHMEIPPLATIPRIENSADVRHAFYRRLATAVAVCAWAGIVLFLVTHPAG